jgi:hypothetical protein
MTLSVLLAVTLVVTRRTVHRTATVRLREPVLRGAIGLERWLRRTRAVGGASLDRERTVSPGSWQRSGAVDDRRAGSARGGVPIREIAVE